MILAEKLTNCEIAPGGLATIYAVTGCAVSWGVFSSRKLVGVSFLRNDYFRILISSNFTYTFFIRNWFLRN